MNMTPSVRRTHIKCFAASDFFSHFVVKNCRTVCILFVPLIAVVLVYTWFNCCWSTIFILPLTQHRLLLLPWHAHTCVTHLNELNILWWLLNLKNALLVQQYAVCTYGCAQCTNQRWHMCTPYELILFNSISLICLCLPSICNWIQFALHNPILIDRAHVCTGFSQYYLTIEKKMSREKNRSVCFTADIWTNTHIYILVYLFIFNYLSLAQRFLLVIYTY